MCDVIESTNSSADYLTMLITKQGSQERGGAPPPPPPKEAGNPACVCWGSEDDVFFVYLKKEQARAGLCTPKAQRDAKNKRRPHSTNLHTPRALGSRSSAAW